jgi:hypothetical protein
VSGQPYGQPTYQQPAYQQQPPPAYQQPPPVYQQPAPAYQQQPPVPGYPPPPPPKKGKGLKITLSVIGGVFLVCAVIACVALYPIYRDSGAHVSAPPTLPGGLSKQDSQTADTLKSSLESDLRGNIDNIDQIETGVYSAKGDADPTHVVILVAATGTFFSPGSEVDSAFKGFSGSGGLSTLSEPKEYPAGSLGGTAKCGSSQYNLGTGAATKLTVSMCVWADHGTIGMVMFMGQELSAVTGNLIPIREAVQTR